MKDSNMENKIIFKTFDSMVEAELVHLKLNENEIPNWILNKKDSAYLTFGEIEIYINQEDLADAQKLIN